WFRAAGRRRFGHARTAGSLPARRPPFLPSDSSRRWRQRISRLSSGQSCPTFQQMPWLARKSRRVDFRRFGPKFSTDARQDRNRANSILDAAEKSENAGFSALRNLGGAM